MSEMAGPSLAVQTPTPGAARVVPGRARASAAVGNQAALRRLQAKLTIGAVDDPLEHEADAAAEQVMRAPDPALGLTSAPPRISRKCAACEDESRLQAKSAGADVGGEAAPTAVDRALSEPGRPLDARTRAFLEPRFGADFSGVRVHTGEAAAQSAKSVGALGYTVGRDIVFDHGRFAPEGDGGRRLLAHELAHILQQDGAVHRDSPSDLGAVDAPPEPLADAAEQLTGADVPQMAMATSAFRLDRKCAACAEEETVQRRVAEDGPPAADTNSLVDQALGSPGRALDHASRDYFEPRFQRDFSAVRVHDGALAARSAKAVNALAYTVGQDIVLGAGAHAPGSSAGRKLMAHELTHTIQQSADGSGGETALRREPMKFTVGGGPGAPGGPMMATDTELYFGRSEVCTSCHQESEENRFQYRPAKHDIVTGPKLVEWASTFVWGEAVIGGRRFDRKHLFGMIQRREDNALDKAWDEYRDEIVAKVAPVPFGDFSGQKSAPQRLGEHSPDDGGPGRQFEDIKHPLFIGSDGARTYWADYLAANWTDVEQSLDQKAIDWLVRDIDEILRSGLVPSRARLVTDPAVIKMVEQHPQTSNVRLKRFNDTASVGFEWLKKRIRSSSPSDIVFEVMGHEGIYFLIDTGDFQALDPFMGKVAGDVAEATAGTAAMGGLIKGFLSGIASPVTMAVKVAKESIDLQTQAVAVAGEWTGWWHTGYTCISAVCEDYDACRKSGKSHDTCQSDAVDAAVKEATIIIPLYQQGRECLVQGNAEACGGIMSLALGLIPEGGGALAEEFEGAAIRQAIERPRAGDASLEAAFERPKSGKDGGHTGSEPAHPTAPPKTKPKAAHDEAKTPAKSEPPAKPKPKAAAPDSVEGFAKAHGIDPARLNAELAELKAAVKDPRNVHRPGGEYDAEIETTVKGEKHTFDRQKGQKGSRKWCRHSPPPGSCGLSAGEDTDALVDEVLGEESWSTDDIDVAPDDVPQRVDPRARGYAIEDQHMTSLEAEGYKPLPDWFKTHDAIRGGTERFVVENGKRIRVIDRPDAISIKSTNITDPVKLTAKVTGDLDVLRGRFEHTRAGVRVSGVRNRRLDLIFDEGVKIGADTQRALEQLGRSAGGIDFNWYVMRGGRQLPGAQYLRDLAAAK